MDLEWEVYHQPVQSQNNFDSAAGEFEEDSVGPSTMPSYDPYKHQTGKTAAADATEENAAAGDAAFSLGQLTLFVTKINSSQNGATPK